MEKYVPFSPGSSKPSQEKYPPVRRNIPAEPKKPVSLLDSLTDTDEEKKEIAKVKADIFKPSDKIIIKVLAIADAVLFLLIGLYIIFSGSGNAYSGIKRTSSFDFKELYYNSANSVFNELEAKIPESEFPYGIQEKFKTIYAANNDVVAWVKSIDSSIDTVVMQSADNDKYLRKDFYLEYAIRGTVFMDYRDNVGTEWNSLSKNTVLYGHNFSEGGQMIFEDIQKYQDLDYYKEHPVILMDTIYNNYKWKVLGTFACYPITEDPELFYYWYTDFCDENTVNFANEVTRRSYVVNPDVDVQPTDKFLTLSTCLHMKTVDGEVVGRYVLVARLVRQGESAMVNTDTAYANENRRMPQVWYDYNGITNPYTDTPIWVAY